MDVPMPHSCATPKCINKVKLNRSLSLVAWNMTRLTERRAQKRNTRVYREGHPVIERAGLCSLNGCWVAPPRSILQKLAQCDRDGNIKVASRVAFFIGILCMA